MLDWKGKLPGFHCRVDGGQTLRSPPVGFLSSSLPSGKKKERMHSANSMGLRAISVMGEELTEGNRELQEIQVHLQPILQWTSMYGRR